MKYTIFFSTIFLIIPLSLDSKIMDAYSFKKMLKTSTNDEVRQEYVLWRENLTMPKKPFPPGIEPDVLLTQDPSYKMEMFTTVVQEIARRLEKAKTPKELSLYADLFFGKVSSKKEKQKRNGHR